MGVFEMVAVVATVGCGTALLVRLIEGWVAIEKAKAAGGVESLGAELKAIREEMRQLREQNADMLLGFDTAMGRLGAGTPQPVRPAEVPPEEGVLRGSARSG